MKRFLSCGILTLASLATAGVEVSAQPAWAQDEGRRTGFIIGLGVGVGRLGISEGDFSESKIGLATDFRLGAQVNPRLQIYYLSKVVFTGGEIEALSQADVVMSSVTGVGITYLFSPQAHLSGGMGIGAWTELSSDGDFEQSFGLGLTGGVGYEFADHWILDVGLSYLRPEFSDLGVTFDVYQLKVALNLLSH